MQKRMTRQNGGVQICRRPQNLPQQGRMAQRAIKENRAHPVIPSGAAPIR